jgi:hypothetical protein
MAAGCAVQARVLFGLRPADRVCHSRIVLLILLAIQIAECFHVVSGEVDLRMHLFLAVLSCNLLESIANPRPRASVAVALRLGS